MSPLSVLAAAEPAATQPSIGTPTLWAVTIGAVLALFALDFVLTRKPHTVSMRVAAGWSAFYVALPLAFGVFVWQRYGGDRGLEYYTGYLVEKSLSVDNLFVFMLLLAAFAVPDHLKQRVLLIGVAASLGAVRTVDRPLRQLVDAADRFGSGDLRPVELDEMPTELGRLALAMEHMGARLRDVVSSVSREADDISTRATDFSAMSEELAASSGEISTALSAPSSAWL